MNELTTQWTYSTDEISEDKSRPRVGTPPGKAFEIIGIDGNMDGGLRPISGFKEVAQLDYYYNGLNADHSDISSAFQFNSTSEVIDSLLETKELRAFKQIPVAPGGGTLVMTLEILGLTPHEIFNSFYHFGVFMLRY